jgi:hypothetical protein
MRNFKHRTAGMVVAIAALAAPATAGAHIETGVSSVRAHTDRADAALERAVALFERDADRRGSAELSRSRRQTGLATAEVAKLRRSADSRTERTEAARAQSLVGEQQDENVEQLVGALDETEGRVESKIAQAALADTRGREKAIAVISAVVSRGVSEKAAPRLTEALAALATDRDQEVEAKSAALTSEDVSAKAKSSLAKSVEASVQGQAKAAERLAALIVDEDVPVAAKPGLQRAYDRVAAEHGTVVDILSRLSERMPASIRAVVEGVVQQGREDAQSMGENRPAAPSGQPDGTPSGESEGTPSGQPEGTPPGA